MPYRADGSWVSVGQYLRPVLHGSTGDWYPDPSSAYDESSPGVGNDASYTHANRYGDGPIEFYFSEEQWIDRVRLLSSRTGQITYRLEVFSQGQWVTVVSRYAAQYSPTAVEHTVSPQLYCSKLRLSFSGTLGSTQLYDVSFRVAANPSGEDSAPAYGQGRLILVPGTGRAIHCTGDYRESEDEGVVAVQADDLALVAGGSPWRLAFDANDLLAEGVASEALVRSDTVASPMRTRLAVFKAGEAGDLTLSGFSYAGGVSGTVFKYMSRADLVLRPSSPVQGIDAQVALVRDRPSDREMDPVWTPPISVQRGDWLVVFSGDEDGCINVGPNIDTHGQTRGTAVVARRSHVVWYGGQRAGGGSFGDMHAGFFGLYEVMSAGTFEFRGLKVTATRLLIDYNVESQMSFRQFIEM